MMTNPLKLNLSDVTLITNAGETQLIESAIRRGEGVLSVDGALSVNTGVHTGRSPKDKFIVKDSLTADTVWWENNSSMTIEAFDLLFADFQHHMQGMALHRQQLFAGADPKHRIGVDVITEFAWHSLFIRHLLIRPKHQELESFQQDLTIINLPSFKADPKRHGCRSTTVIACDFSRKLVLIGGTEYAGENKKAVFTYLNFSLPAKGVMPMHCSANVGKNGEVAVFFGLSGTGKTTLSADSNRALIGDDEHGWSESGIFNFEGGCYAKTIRLSHISEPEIYTAAKRFGTVLENVTLDEVSRLPDYDDGSKTENTRAAYPLDAISNVAASGKSGHPRAIIMLTCDAFGVLPPIAKLNPDQAMAHFLAGYTAKVAGTERNVSEPQATFSACFGAPFMPRRPEVYGHLLKELIAKHKVECWLVNTGWTGGAYGTGRRMPLKVTRQLVFAALSGSLGNDDLISEDAFGLQIPKQVDGIPDDVLAPSKSWESSEEYATAARSLRDKFEQAAGRHMT